MKYSIEKLTADVMARLGEIARPQSALSEVTAFPDLPWPEDIVGIKVKSLLGEAGAKLILEAPVEMLGGGQGISGVEVAMREMPCGLYGAEVRLPEGFLRMVSAKMAGWQRSVHALILPESTEWSRQWSAESGIAGSPECPRAYLDSGAAGMLLRLVGSESEDDGLEWISGWCVPKPDDDGEFEFPESLYGELVGVISERLV